MCVQRYSLDQRRRCASTSLFLRLIMRGFASPLLSDLGKGDVRDGWLRIQDDMYYSIEIGGWVMLRYGSNDGVNISNTKNSLYIKDYVGLTKFDKKTGKVTMNYSTKDMSQKLVWSCDVGLNQPNNSEM
ncbi:hypothetical protein [Vibrio splendidus]|uniref:hypothetical protein n=1 Tax=Vibrio splendidus TaxID=29497 RepID=UPI0024682BAC|nr:hypothetical protein [Vibrio splendidus]MDH5931957.1 hypothetical protein [Vibrio splendidus]